MTAMRIAGIATITAVILAAASLLWQTDVPDDLVLRATRGSGLPGAARAEEYGSGLRLLWLGGAAAQLVLAGVLAWRWRPRHAVRALLVVLAGLWLARLPFRAGAHGWRRRYGTTDQPWLDWLVSPWAETIGAVVVALAALGVGIALARRFGPRWWRAGGPAIAGLGAAAILLQPLVFAPRLEPLRDRQLLAAIDAGMPVDVKRAHDRTNRINAEVAGIGPSRRVILWDTLLDRRVPRPEVVFIAAHELGHVREHHLWKGLAWFGLAAVPLAWAIARVTERRGGLGSSAAVPLAVFAVLVLQLALLVPSDAISRRYEAEADWVALQRTEDPGAAVGLFRRFVVANLADPDPPTLLSTHPSLVDRIAMARAWSERRPRRYSLGGASGRFLIASRLDHLP
jgi:STE24 endopeptidase